MIIQRPELIWPDAPLDLQDAILLIELQANQPFKLSWIIEQIKHHCNLRNKNPDHHIQNLLDHSYYLGNVPIQNNDIFYYPAQQLFTGTQFRIQPTKEELENDLLIIGHRFYPWLSFFTALEEIQVRHQDQTINLVSYESNFEHLQFYHHLFNFDDILSLIEPIDHLYSEDYTLYEVLALDLTDFYQQYNFHNGDQIRATVLQYYPPIIQLEYISKEDFFREKKAIVELDKRLLQDLHQHIQETQQQLSPFKALLNAYARFWHAGKPLQKAFTNWANLLDHNRFIRLFSFEKTPYLMNCEQTEEEVINNIYKSITLIEKDGRCETLEDIFFSTSELNTTILKAYIIYNLSFDLLSSKELLTNILKIYPFENLTLQQHEIFEELYQQFFNDVVEEALESFPSKEVQRFRLQILKSIEQIQHFFQDFTSVKENTFWSHVLFKVNLITHDFNYILELLENDSQEDIELPLLKTKVMELKNTWDELNRQIIRKYLE